MHKLAEFIIRDAKGLGDMPVLAELTGKTLLITGSSGLIGHYFLSVMFNLAKAGKGPKKVYALVQNPPEYFSELAGFEGAEILRGDLTDQKFLQSLPQADYIIHAAGYGQPGKFLQNPDKTIFLNTAATFELFKKLKLGGKFLFISTSEVYSGLPEKMYLESEIGTTTPQHPRASYIEAKRCGEAIVEAFRSKGVDAKSGRLALAYGPGTKKDDARVLNNFIAKGLLNKKIELMDKGLATRTYCYVTDAVEILWKILLAGKESLYNVGGESKITIAALANLVGSELNVPVIFPAEDHSAVGHPQAVGLNINKAKQEFAKIKFVDMQEGLKRTISWQQELFKS